MTSSPGRQVSIRPPLLARMWVAAFMLFWLGAVVWTTMIRQHGWSVAIGVVFIAFGALIGWRGVRLGVRSDSDGILTIHNSVGDRRLSRSQIEEFRVGANGGSRIGQRGVQVLLRDGTAYGLDVCGTPFGFGTRRLTTQVEQLNTWLRTQV